MHISHVYALNPLEATTAPFQLPPIVYLSVFVVVVGSIAGGDLLSEYLN